MLLRASLSLRAASRGLATKKTSVKQKAAVSLGWDKLIDPLEAVPLRLPLVKSLQVVPRRAAERGRRPPTPRASDAASTVALRLCRHATVAINLRAPPPALPR